MQACEDGDQEDEAQDAAPDFGIGPGVDAAAPLEGEEEADDRADQEEGAEEVDLVDLLFRSHSTVFAGGVLEEEEYDGDGAATHR